MLPAYHYGLQGRLDSCQIRTTVAVNGDIGVTLDTINYLKIVVSDVKDRTRSILIKSSGLIDLIYSVV